MPTKFAPVDMVHGGQTLWRALALYGDLPSTNHLVVRIPNGGREGVVVVAENAEGHGRWARGEAFRGRTLLASFLVRNDDFAPMLVSAMAGLAGIAACRAFVPDAELHWPDTFFHGGLELGGARIDQSDEMLAFGFGIDIDMRGVEAPAGTTSLVAASGGDVDRWAVLTRLMEELDRTVRLARSNPKQLLADYRAQCASVGRHVSIVTSGGKHLSGVVRALGEDGELTLVEDGGGIRTLIGGEVERVDPKPRDG